MEPLAVLFTELKVPNNVLYKAEMWHFGCGFKYDIVQHEMLSIKAYNVLRSHKYLIMHTTIILFPVWSEVDSPVWVYSDDCVSGGSLCPHSRVWTGG